MNDLSTILDTAGAAAEVQKWLVDSWMERASFDWGLADSKYLDSAKLPEGSGQYIEVSRQNEPRRPQNLRNSAQTSDPACGMTLGEAKFQLPIEYIQEYVAIGTTAQLTSRHDLEQWAKEDLPRAYMKRQHELVQNAVKMGRATPGYYAANGTCTVAFDASAEAAPTINGVTFNFAKGKSFFAQGKPLHAALGAGDIPSMSDFDRIHAYFVLNGAPKFGNRYIAYISDATKQELMKDEGFRDAVLAWAGKGIADGAICDYHGWKFMEDDAPLCEAIGAENVRVAYGPLHTSVCLANHGVTRLTLGGRSSLKPKFKIQDITLTGVSHTIGYLIPSQVGVARSEWCATLVGAVTNWDPTNM